MGSGTTQLRWLDGAPRMAAGVTFGVPWPRGEVQGGEPIGLQDAGGDAIPAQSWPLGYWPDGSVKWSALAATVDPGHAAGLSVVRGEAAPPVHPLRVDEADGEVTITSGKLRCRVAIGGTQVIRQLTVGGRPACSGAQLVCRRERRRHESAGEVREVQELTGRIEGALVEQRGPLRAVIRLHGNPSRRRRGPAAVHRASLPLRRTAAGPRAAHLSLRRPGGAGLPSWSGVADLRPLSPTRTTTAGCGSPATRQCGASRCAWYRPTDRAAADCCPTRTGPPK